MKSFPATPGRKDRWNWPTAFSKKHPYLLQTDQRQALSELVETAENEMEFKLPEGPFLQILESVPDKLSVDMGNEGDLSPYKARLFELPGDRGGILFRVTQNPGPVSFQCAEANLSREEKNPVPTGFLVRCNLVSAQLEPRSRRHHAPLSGHHRGGGRLHRPALGCIRPKNGSIALRGSFRRYR